MSNKASAMEIEAEAEKVIPVSSKPKKRAGPVLTRALLNVMILDSIDALKERNGLSSQTILRHIKANYAVEEDCDKKVRLAIWCAPCWTQKAFACERKSDTCKLQSEPDR